MFEKDIDEFRAAHRNRTNQNIHIACGLVYMAMLFRCLGGYAMHGVAAYAALLAVTLPDYVPLSALAIAGTALLTSLAGAVPVPAALAAAAAFYMAPEIGHMLAKEPPVLKYPITLRDGALNVLYLLPFSLITSARTC